MIPAPPGETLTGSHSPSAGIGGEERAGRAQGLVSRARVRSGPERREHRGTASADIAVRRGVRRRRGARAEHAAARLLALLPLGPPVLEPNLCNIHT